MSRFCLACGKPVADNSDTALMAPPLTPTSPAGTSRAAAVPARVSAAEGRFVAGMVVSARYQIIGLLGKGGMGEVYRANDQTLDQPVALKFLPEAMARDAAMLARFHNETRIARQVSHPNVCRVYDLGEADGRPFLSMEYIDGEDLGSLLRRIGRLPADKAIEFARRICAGLAAAHDRGVLHRDLKPSNIMIDSRGQVFITDFGLAAVTGELRQAQAREGTPAYMAPEQLAGGEVTARSDIYALGLVLYEMFTGKRPFEASTLAEMIRLQQTSTPASLSDTVKDVDPAVERVIQRCLAADPLKRPASPLAIAAALPGGDPLAAALAAGETPSPELVAAGAGQTAGMRPVVGVAYLAALCIGLVAAMLLTPRTDLMTKIAMEYPPDALAAKSRDLALALGYTGKPAGRAYGFSYDRDYLRYIERLPAPSTRWARRLGNAQPAAIVFWYRESPRPLTPDAFAGGGVSPDNPPPIVSGMLSVELDPQGRLVQFNVVPPQVDRTAGSAPPDWKPLFDAAGLDISRFSASTPEWTPPGIADARGAWTGDFPGEPATPVRVEAAAWRGKPTYFQIIGPWTRPSRMEQFREDPRMMAIAVGGGTAVLLLMAATVILARNNVKRGRGDRRSALRLAGFTGFVFLLLWAFGGSHVADFGEILLFAGALSFALFLAGVVWLLYMAVEPIARRRWPHSMIGWSRLLAGGFRDPVVGRDVLAGIVFGIGSGLAAALYELVALPLGANYIPTVSLDALLGARGAVAAFLGVFPNCVIQALVWFVLFFILRVLLRRDWLAAAGYVLINVVLHTVAFPTAPVAGAVFAAAETMLIVFALLRFGLLALTATAFVYELLILFPITADFSAWYAGASMFAVLTVVAAGAFAFHTSLAGRSLLGDADL